MTRISRRTIFIALILILLSSGVLAACSSNAEASGTLPMAPMADMPAQVQSAPATVRQAYQFAVANSEVLKQIPCYCGCGNMGHTSNYSCYVQDVDSKGAVSFDTHALGCSICVDITQDTMRQLRQGKSITEIKTNIDNTYSQYGPSNIPGE